MTKKYVVRFGAMRNHGIIECVGDDSASFGHGSRVIVKTSRGHELATVLCVARKKRSPRKNEQCKNEQVDKPTFVRRLTPEDEERLNRIKANERNDFDRCLKIVRRMNIKLSLVCVERIFGGERIVVYYVANGRVDFRELVRVLATEFKSRIEMRQIGVRDETKLYECLGDCGRDLCCRTFLVSTPPVSMKMVKLQKATLDPTKVSGRCGRLKCCLRFEHDVYRDLQRQSPPIDSTVMTPDGKGRVVAQELLAGKVVVCLENRARNSYDVDAVSLLSERSSTRSK